MAGIRALLIEDNPIDACIVKEVLSNTPEIHLETIDRLSRAVEYLASDNTDVVLLDLGLPDSVGLDTLRALSKAAPHVPVVVLNEIEDQKIIRRAIRLGAQDYLVKPVMQGASLARILHFAVERKRAERALHISETKYQRLHESLMDGFVRVDMQGHIVDSNSTYQKMLGYSEDELHSLTYLQLTPERWHAVEAKIIAEQIIPRGYSEVYEKEYRRKDGVLLPVELRKSLLKDESGAPASMWAIVRDLSERKEAENSLRASEERVRRKLDSVLSPEGNLGILDLAEIIDVPEIQSLMDSFYKLARIPMSIIDLKGRVLVGVGWQDICTKFHRIHPDACSCCLESDLKLSRGIIPGEFRLYKCKNNMWDVATPIMMGGSHVGNVFAGQFFFADETLDYDLFRSQARRYGFDEKEYIAALEAVPRLSRESVDTGMAFFMKLADMLSKLSYSNIKLARSLAERDRLLDSLREGEARFRQLFNAAAVPLCFVNKHGILVDTNDRFVKIFGYSHKDVSTLKEWWQASCPDPEYRRWAEANWDSSLRLAVAMKGDIMPMECRATCKNGEVRTLVISGITIGDNFLATFYDITERKQAEEVLHTSEARLSNALKMARLGHWEYDVANDLFTFNDHLYAVMRTTAEREGGYVMSSAQYVERFVHPDDRFRVSENFRRTLRTVDPHYTGQLEHRMIYADGEFGYASVRFFIERDEKGRLLKTHGVTQDITERKRAEGAIQKREEQYRLIADNTTDVIWLFDLVQNRFIYISPSVEKLRGFKVEEALPQSMQDILTPASYRMLTEDLSKRIATFEAGDVSLSTQTYEVDQVRKDGSIVATETVTTLIADEQKNIKQLQGITRDITERKSLQRQLLQAQKMEAIGRLAGGVAHDFNNLLTVIIGYSDSLLKSFPQGDPVREELDQIKKAADRATALTSKLLAFSRKQVLQPKVIDLKALVQESVRLLRRLIGEDIELITDLASDLGCVKADTSQMDQVIINLAVNSRDAMPLGGKLILVAANASLDEEFVRNHVGSRQGEYAMLAVIDTGTGMDAETKSRLFEPFFTTKAMGKGTGLGLATVHGIINQSGGFITVDSEPGRGSTFKIYLPRVDKTDELMHPGEIAVSGGSETILLVEDDDEVRKLASRYLQAKGFSVIEANNGPNAIRIAGAFGRTIHLLITDMVMPGGLNGCEVFRFVKRSHPNIRILIITGYIGELTTDGILSPDTAILQKPFTADDLTRRVQEVLQERKA